jgi:hypothetical protein
MTREASAYMARETVVSLFFSIALSEFFGWLIFHGSSIVAPWGPHGLVADAVPQTFMMTLMCVLIPSLLTRVRLGKGQCANVRVLPGLETAAAPTRSGIALRAAIIAVVVMAIGVGATAAVMATAFPEGMAFPVMMAFKGVYGAIVGLVVTPLAITCVLHEGHILRYARATLNVRGNRAGPANP